MSIFYETIDPALMDFRQSLEAHDAGYDAEPSGHTRELDNSGHTTLETSAHTRSTLDSFEIDEGLEFADDISLQYEDFLIEEDDEIFDDEIEDQPQFMREWKAPNKSFSWKALKETSIGCLLKKSIGTLSASFDDSLRSMQSTSCSESEESEYESSRASRTLNVQASHPPPTPEPRPFNLSFASIQEPIIQATRRWNDITADESGQVGRDSSPSMPKRSWNQDREPMPLIPLPFSEDEPMEESQDTLSAQFSELFTPLPRALYALMETDPPTETANFVLPSAPQEAPATPQEAPTSFTVTESESEPDPPAVTPEPVYSADACWSPEIDRVRKKKPGTKKKKKQDPSTKQQRTSTKPKPDKRTGRDRRRDPEVKTFVDVTEKDVLFGRGGLTNHRIGNKRYRELILSLQPQYKLLENHEKTEMSSKVVDDVMNSGGRFLKRDTSGPLTEAQYFIVTKGAARQKVAQALREDHTPEGRAAKRARTKAFSMKSKPSKRSHAKSSRSKGSRKLKR